MEIQKLLNTYGHEIQTYLSADHQCQSQRKQAFLLINRGGLGIRRIEDISIPAFLSSNFSR